MATPLALVFDLIARDGASPTFNRVAASADRAAVATGRTEKAVVGISGKMKAAFAGLAIGAVGVEMVKSAVQFQKSMLLIQTQAGATSGEVQRMSKALLGLAGKVATAPEDLALSLYHIESAGLRGAKALDVVKIAAEGAKVGNADLEQTTNALTSAVVSGIGGVKNMQQAMGVLNAIVGAGDMKLSDLNAALGTGLLKTASVFGVSIQEVGAALAVFGDNNIRGADAATKLRMVMQDLSKPAAHADDVLSKIHLTADDLRNSLTQHGLNDALELLKSHLDAAGVTGSKIGAFLEDAFTKKAGVGLATLLTSMGRFELKLREVTDKGTQFGADWKATTQTASFAFDKIKAQVEAFGISIGTKLLPYVTEAAQWLGTNLPKILSTLGQILGPLAHTIGSALGTAFRILVPVVKAAWDVLAGIGHFLATNSGLVKGFAIEVIALWAAFKGFAIAQAALVAIPALFRAIMAAGEEMGASLIASMNPVVIAIAAVATIIVGVVNEFNRSSASAAAYAAAVKADIGGLTPTLNQHTAAITQATEAWVQQQLVQAGSYDAASKLGLSIQTVTNAALGNKKALDTVGKSLKAAFDSGDFQGVAAIQKIAELGDAARGSQHQILEYNRVNHIMSDGIKVTAATAQNLTSTFRDQVPSVLAATHVTRAHAAATTQLTKADEQYATMAGLVVSKNGVVAGSARRVMSAVSAVRRITLSGSAAVGQFASAWQAFAKSSGSAADRAAIIGATLKVANGDALSYQSAINTAAQSSHSFFTDIKAAAKTAGDSLGGYLSSLVNLKTGTIDYHQAAAGPLLADLQSMQDAAMGAAQAQFQHAKQTMSAKDAADQAYQVYKNQTSTALIDEATKLGLTTGQAKKLADQYFGMPPKVKTTIEAEGTDPILTVLNKIGHLLANLTHQQWNTKVNVDTTAAMTNLNALRNTLGQVVAYNGDTIQIGVVGHGITGNATGGAIRGPGTARSDSILARLSDGEHVLTASDVTKAGGQGAIYRMRQAIQAGALKFGGGGAVRRPTARNYFEALLHGLGAPVTSSNLRALYGVSTLEGWNERYNPLNVIQPEPGSHPFNSVGVQAYPNMATGVKGALDLFKRNGVWNGVVAALRDGSSRQAVLNAFAGVYSGWDPGVHFPAVPLSAGGTRIGPHGGSLAGLPSGGGGGGGGGRGAKRSSALSLANTLLSGIGSRSSSQINVGDTGIGLVERQIAAASSRIANIAHLKPKDRARFHAELVKLVKEAQKQIDKLALHIRTDDLKSLQKALSGTAADVRASFKQIVGDLRHLGARDGLIGRLRHLDDRIARDVADRNRAAAKLASVQQRDKQLTSSVQAAALGAFDVTSAGVNPVSGNVTAGSLIAQQSQALRKVQMFGKDLRKLESRGLNRAYLRQLASAGPSVLPQLEALLQMSDRQFGQFNRQEGDLLDSAKGIGNRTGNFFYRNRERDLRQQERTDEKHIRTLSRELAKELRKGVHVTVVLDGRKLNRALDESRNRHNDLHGASS